MDKKGTNREGKDGRAEKGDAVARDRQVLVGRRAEMADPCVPAQQTT